MSKMVKILFLIIAVLIPTLSYAAAGETTANLWPWYIARASGLVAYILLFLLVVTGVGIKTFSIFKFIRPAFALLNHRYLGTALTVSVLVHMVSLLFDKYINFSLLDVFIPFSSSFKPVFLSLGILGFYFLIAVIVSSIFTISKFPKAWRLLHYLPYPMFVILFIHGYFIGTDTKFLIIKLIYIITAIIFGLVSSYRLYFSINKNK